MIKKLIYNCCKNNIRRSESNETLLERDILNYNIGKLVGEGKFGKVYVCYNKVKNKNYAIKKSVKSNYLFSNELKYLRMLYHSSIIRLHDSFIYEGHHF